ncbi:MAG TPA: hypothetical protein EYQ31_09360 [Candidatus Handelsmanbacteria bacterium]|nr:hypothetical protein [Candidatus Handelsmanbacteria bacterium]
MTWAKQFDPNAKKYVKDADGVDVKQRHGNFDGTIGNVVQIINRNPMLSWAVPFPRFMANSYQWQLNHSPVGLSIALFSPRGIALMKKGDYSEVAEGMAGFAMFGAAMALAESEYAIEGSGTEILVPPSVAEALGIKAGTTLDLRAYAPFLSYYWMAHTMKRHFDGKPPPPITEIVQVIGGANMRAGMGLYVLDQLVEDLASVGRSTGGQGALAKTGEIGGGLIGNVIASHFVPLNFLYDNYKAFEQWQGNIEPSKVRDAGGFAQEAPTRGVINLGHDKPWYDAGISNFYHSALGQIVSRTPLGSMETGGTYKNAETGENVPYVNYPEVELATRREAPYSYAPLWKAWMGMTFKSPKTALERETLKHGFSQSDILPNSGNDLWHRQVARQMGPVVEDHGINELLENAAYQSWSDTNQVSMLREWIKAARVEAIRIAGNRNPDLRELVKRENADYRRLMQEEGGWISETETKSESRLDFQNE